MQTLTASIRPVSEQISEFADNYPHSIALSHGNLQLSYEDLDRRADRFAGHLMQLGIASGGTVAICMERSFDWIVAALGIMRTGAAYVPLDSAWPDSRVRFAVNDSEATILVARAALLDRLQVKVHGVDPCRDAAIIAAELERESRSVLPESLAYVIYTSGSTGVPKGVEITHANLSHLIGWHRDRFRVTQQDRASHLAGLGFDAAVWEIWPHLATGATVCLADDAIRSSPDLMQQWLIRESVTIAFVPTVLAAPMMAMEWPVSTALRVLLTGGDALYRAPATPLPFDVLNNYGPTECTVVATSAVLKPGSHGTPPIGRPIAGARVYLLNEHGEQVPDGRTGEIYIGGSGVGRGYRNLPESTERNFLPDPFAGEPGARMYRTGDRGVRRPDGQIEFRGRFDRQTKIRGQRVELGEIESVLAQHPSIDFAAAITNISEAGENQLVACVLPKKNARVPNARELQKYLLRSLPNYMVPDIFVRLHLPSVSANGKLDLTILAHPTDGDLLESAAPKTPARQIEEKLLTVVRELLENDKFEADDNFFLAGGHSLLGMQLVMRVQKAFDVDLTMQQLFGAPTVERLAIVVETMLDEARLTEIWGALLGRNHIGLDDNFFDVGGHPDLVVALQRRIATDFGSRISIAELFLSPTLREQAQLTQRGAKDEPVLPPGVLALHPYGARNSIFWMHYVNGNLAKAMGEDQPFLVVTLTAEDLASLGEAPTLQSLAECHLRKILATQSQGPYTIGGQCLGGILAYEIATQLKAAGHEVSLLVLLDTPNPSYLESHVSLSHKFTYLCYLQNRAAQLGLRTSLDKLRTRLFNRLTRTVRTKSVGAEFRVAQEVVEAAARAYQSCRYEGRVLLLLASDRPPHMDYLPGWQAVVPNNLHIRYVNGRHAELLNRENVRSVADAIVPHLTSTTGERPLVCETGTPGSTGRMQETKLTSSWVLMNDEARAGD
jgi:amino acid adenylation domain-containing protein